MNLEEWKDYQYSYKRLEQIKSLNLSVSDIKKWPRLYAAGMKSLIDSNVFVPEDKEVVEKMIKGEVQVL